ncbi:heavy metal translocating P-type ATPase [Mycoplasmatota bacterium]|nr:heavy metal translocating P-type ATPase [Mycoplasmatota bacterium]
MRYSMKVEGITCSNCAKTIENTFQLYERVSCKVNVSANKIIFNYDSDLISLTQIADIVRQAGYTPILDTDTENSQKDFKRDILISLLLTTPLLWTMWHHLGATWMTPKLSMFLMQPLVQIILATPVQFYVGRRFFIGLYHSARKKVFGMDALVVLGTLSAYIFSVIKSIEALNGGIWIDFSTHMMPELYFETSATIITVILIGNYIEHIAKNRTSDALVDLINLGAKEARIKVDNVEKMIPIEDVKIGDLVIVLANEKIPVDGIIVEGNSYVDESMINGEPIPTFKEHGSEVIGATLNTSGKIVIKTTRVGSETVLAKIIETVEEVSASKPPIQRIADKISTIFVPIVLSISTITFIIWFSINQDISLAFEAAVAVMVISCPCALGLATPTSILVGSGRAAKEGILYKGGEFFETANKINAVCFDKTGTLTIGKPVVTDYFGNIEIFDYVYSLEKQSVHPLSIAIVNYKESIDYEVVDFENISGMGLIGTINDKIVAVGSIRLMSEIKVNIDKFKNELTKLQNEGKTIIYVSIDGKIEALIGIADVLKPDAKNVIHNLHARGIDTYMISGDNKFVANAIAKQLNIKNVYGEVLPSEKADIVTKIKADGKFVAFIGDGVNDAPALKAADVGIAMSSGSDIAIDSSDVTLLSHDLNLVNKAIDISIVTFKNILQNFGWAFGYNILAIPLAASGMLNPMIAGIAMAFSNITVVSNALRLKRYKFKNYKEDSMEKVTLNVPSMACGHCKGKIDAALRESNIDATVNLDNKTVLVNENDSASATSIIETAGYPVEK